jgi:Ca2+-binding EF-hand superfamily protein
MPHSLGEIVIENFVNLKGKKMKSLIKPLIASAIIIVSSSVVHAASYSEDKLKNIINSQDDDCNEQVNIKEFTKDKSSYDQNQDGYITRNEIAIELEEGLEETIKELKKHGVSETNINKTVTSELKSISKESAVLIKKMDLDGDSLVEPEELEAFKEAQFEKLDKNRDGVLSSSDTTKKARGGFGFRYQH